MSTHDRPAQQAPFEAMSERVSVVLCRGELDLASSVDLRGALDAAVAERSAGVVVDLAEVTFFDCSAIGELVRARAAARRQGAELVVRSVSPFGRRVLRAVGLSGMVVPPDPGSGVGAAGGTHGASVDGVVTWWREACETVPFGATPLGFDEPHRIVEALLGPSGSGPPRGEPTARFLVEAARASRTGVAVATMQLLALLAVVHQRHPVHVGRSRGHEIAAAIAALVSGLEQTALVDPLTGLLNRRALHRDLQSHLGTARRRRQCLSVVMIDVDGLKRVNDTGGHAAGDAALRGVAHGLATALRAGDNAYRLGGDEFVLVLQDLCPEDVSDVIGRVMVEEAGTFSWGCAWVRGGDEDLIGPEVAAQLLRIADERMLAYRHRTQGSGRSEPEPDRTVRGPAEVPESGPELAGRLRAGNRDLVLIEQARGVIAEHFETDLSAAAAVLHAYAREHDQTVAAVAAALIDGSIDTSELRATDPDAVSPPVGPTGRRAAPSEYGC